MSQTDNGYIPSLMSHIYGNIYDRKERAAYLLTYFIYNPGNVTTRLKNKELSLRHLASSYGHAKEQMSMMIIQQLTSIYSAHFPNEQINVKCDIKSMGNTDDYGIIIDISSYNSITKRSESLISEANIESKPNNEFNLKLPAGNRLA